ncbi:MAG: hypothetical protein DRJ60_04140 [Thermoprotei archaeon]|nr:MAG: hypothetical protein DRJ60_04140 [Thermoprotei archaeon]
MVLVIKKASEEKIRQFKAEAVRRGLTLSKAFEEAVDLWLSTSSKALVSIEDFNNRVFAELKEEIDKHVGKYVVIANGKLIGVFDDVKDIAKALKEVKAQHAIVYRPGIDKPVSGVLEWWGSSIELKPA